MKRVLMLLSNPRPGGMTQIVAEALLAGLNEGGFHADCVNLCKSDIKPCLGCYSCIPNSRCVHKDDMREILRIFTLADAVICVSPVYFYSVDAQMKALIDRTVAQWLTIKNKEFYYIMTSAEESDTVMDCTLECLRGLAKCLKGSVERGVIYGKGVYAAGEIESRPAMQEAYEMGRRVYMLRRAAGL